MIGALVFLGLPISAHPAAARRAGGDLNGLAGRRRMSLVGLGSVLAGGCPFRNLILTGEGNADSGVFVLGMIVGGAFAHNFGLASSPKGITTNGMIAVVLGLALMLAIGYFMREK